MSRFLVQSTNNIEDKKEIFKQRYKICVEEQAQNQKHANHKRKMICDDLDDFSTLYSCKADGRLVASARVTWGSLMIPKDAEMIYNISSFSVQPHKISFTNRLVIEPDWRCSMAMFRMADYMYRDVLCRGIELDFTFCRSELVSLYLKIGYRVYKNSVFFEDLGEREVLFFATRDVRHMAAVRSVCLRALMDWTTSSRCSGSVSNQSV